MPKPAPLSIASCRALVGGELATTKVASALKCTPGMALTRMQTAEKLGLVTSRIEFLPHPVHADSYQFRRRSSPQRVWTLTQKGREAIT